MFDVGNDYSPTSNKKSTHKFTKSRKIITFEGVPVSEDAFQVDAANEKLFPAAEMVDSVSVVVGNTNFYYALVNEAVLDFATFVRKETIIPELKEPFKNDLEVTDPVANNPDVVVG